MKQDQKERPPNLALLTDKRLRVPSVIISLIQGNFLWWKGSQFPQQKVNPPPSPPQKAQGLTWQSQHLWSSMRKASVTGNRYKPLSRPTPPLPVSTKRSSIRMCAGRFVILWKLRIRRMIRRPLSVYLPTGIAHSAQMPTPFHRLLLMKQPRLPVLSTLKH